MKMQIEQDLIDKKNKRIEDIEKMKDYLINAYNNGVEFVSFALDENDGINLATLKSHIESAIYQAERHIRNTDSTFYGTFYVRKERAKDKYIIRIVKFRKKEKKNG